jgi:hypothetical protein
MIEIASKNALVAMDSQKWIVFLGLVTITTPVGWSCFDLPPVITALRPQRAEVSRTAKLITGRAAAGKVKNEQSATVH